LSQLQESCPPEVLYDNYVTFSGWKHQAHLVHEVNYLISLPGINTNSSAIEVGSNDGNFLEGLRAAGLSNLLGIEPALDAFNISTQKGFNVINKFLTLDVINKIYEKNGKFDLFVSRQNLEHIQDLDTFKLAINKLLRIGGYVLMNESSIA
jgi:2-polyprenyl-3-methyl-5-hydroxy-6-metoxy-1,4-benzoquinol methylase